MQFKANGHHDGNRLREFRGASLERFGRFESRAVEKGRSVLLANRHAYDASVGTDFDRELHLALLPRLTGAARIGFVRFDYSEEFRDTLDKKING